MQLFFNNRLHNEAYIAIVDYDKQTNYISEPHVFKLDPRHVCTYESTPTHFVAINVNGYYINNVPRIENEAQYILCVNPLGNPHHYSHLDVDPFELFHDPNAPSAQIINNEVSQNIKNEVFQKLSVYYTECYNEIIKEPEDD